MKVCSKLLSREERGWRGGRRGGGEGMERGKERGEERGSCHLANHACTSLQHAIVC